jgi:amidase
MSVEAAGGLLPDATSQIEMIASRQMTPKELVEEAISRIERDDRNLESVAILLFNEALRLVEQVDVRSVASGIPFLLKDYVTSIAGFPHYMGNRALRDMDFRSPDTSVLAQRLLDAGMIPVGKSTTPEFASGPHTSCCFRGPTRNPWDWSRSPGGSSGGSAAAVAAGLVPLAHGQDAGGSIRIPAAWCGVFGLKPTHKAFGPAPEFVITRSERDAELMLRLLRPELYSQNRVARGRRVGLINPWEVFSKRVSSDCRADVEDAGRRLEGLDYEVIELNSDILLWDDLLITWEVHSSRSLAAFVDGIAESIGRPLQDSDLEPYNVARLERGRSRTDSEIRLSRERLEEYRRRVDNWWRDIGCTFLITPVTAIRPALIREMTPPQKDPGSIDSGIYTQVRAFTRPFSVTGHPALSIPLGRDENGLPRAVQLAGPSGSDRELLEISEVMRGSILQKPVHRSSRGEPTE